MCDEKRFAVGLTLVVVLGLGRMCPIAGAANWSVSMGNAITLDTATQGLSVAEMSGVAYLGPSPVVGKHRFLTVQDDGSGVVTFDATFSLTGDLVLAEAIGIRAIGTGLDTEGIALRGDSIFLSEEDGPGVREYDMASGSQLQAVSIPSIFSANVRGNRGFEALAYDEQQSRFWTSNEEALSVDGPVATSSNGTTVRLLELKENEGAISAGEQYAYQVEAIHGSDSDDATRSGLAELVILPDGTLMAVERSLAAGLPPYRNRFYEIDFAGASDISLSPFDTGLAGQNPVPVGKELLWSGSVGGFFGQNLEGLTVGPRLPNGDWILLGVVDSGDTLSGNTLATFRATPTIAIPLEANNADFDADADVDGDDFLAWQRGRGVTSLAGSNHGDANHDGTVSGADLTIWKNQFGVANLSAVTQTIPEPTSLALAFLVASGLLAARRRR